MTHLIYPRSKNFLPLILSFLLTAFAFAQEEKEVSHTIYFTANTGVEKNSVSDQVLGKILEFSKEGQDSSTVVVLGNLTRKVGYPDKDNGRENEEKFLKESLLEPLKGYKGKIIFIPGKNEWNAKGHKSIDDLESYLQDNSEAKFWPNDGCPIERETLSDQVELVMVDSQWYLEDWDDHPYINNKCEIKTRKDFIAQFKDELKDEQNKTIIVAIHHPVLSNNKKGFIGRMGGFSSQDYYSTKMQELIGQLETLAEQFNDVIFVSGNHRNLQYLDDDGVPQIISGASHKIKGARAKEDKGHYASKKNGFSKLTAYKDGSSKVDFYTLEDNNQFRLSFSKNIKSKRITIDEVDWQDKSTYGPTIKASVYTEEETDKSGLYKLLWGDHYREVYSKKIEVPVLFLDDLPNNPVAITEGGGKQSRSLRLRDENDHEYTIRELEKSAVRFIQASIKDHYVIDYMQNTIAEDLVKDYYTTAHPYATYSINDLLDQVDIYHAKPKIFYVPKQKNLGVFNEDYGDKLYMFEAHVGDENKDLEIFGNADDILSTKDMILKFQDDKDVKIDESTYIRARIFDMLVGDWDRHQDQWRWAEFEEDGKKVYKAIPRDRDQPYSKYDGFMVGLLKIGVPALRVMQTYEPTVKSTKWFNDAGYPIDKLFINEATWEDWEREAKYVQAQITDEVIERSFRENLPADAQDETIEQIKVTLRERRKNLVDITRDYFEYFKKHEVIVGTNEDNTFNITREDNGVTRIEILEDDEMVRSVVYSKDQTKEVWVYGLDGDDTFKISGDGNRLIKLKILGGEENDIYDFDRTTKTRVYDYVSKDNTFKNVGIKRLTDDYDTNNYNYTKKTFTTSSFLPVVGSDPDAGFKAGLTHVWTKYGLVRNPFSIQHTTSLNYYSATNGLELNYFGEFAHFFNNWNFGIEARITNESYALNYFGVGNETEYDNDIDRDYNRVEMQQWSFAPSLMYKNNPNLSFYVKPLIESFELNESDNNQLIDELPIGTNDVYRHQIYAGGEVGLNYNNKGTLIAYPRRGIELGINGGYKSTIDSEFDNQFAYVNPLVSFIYPIHESGAAVIATKAEADFIIGDQYEFYHAATVGGNQSLRGFRNDRFLGETSFYQTTDLRVGLTKFKTNFVPIRLGVTGGFDYGRVWLDNDNSEKWHTSYGGSVFVNGFNALTANIGYYVSDEDQRVLFSVGFRF
ncbi:metallophosphatase [Mesonia sp. K7]|uniref:metallophosphatase n=1 Tax=Mesonia sp. K7 TaxID=2218606 RepID=UPI000DAABDB5|nr:metallophosphatase [Mesonia sp. K7]PZD76692.1 metallophosphatase [Mesonia sp. K7]